MPADRGLALLPVLPWTGAALLAVLLVALNVPPPDTRRPRARVGGSLVARPLWAAAVGACALVLLVVARTGPTAETANVASLLLLGLGWPLLLLVPAAVGLLHRPAARSDDEPGAPRDARPAVAVAAALVGYLVLVPAPGSPRTLAVALAAYLLVLAALAVALGGAAVARTDALGLLARWAALGPRLVRWHPPRGAAAVLAVVLGGAWAERAQRTAGWADLGGGRPAQVLLVAGAVGLAGLAALALTRWSDGRAAPVLLPVAGAAAVALVLRRALISAQLLWDVVGPGSPGVSPDPLGVAGGQALALAVVTLGGALAAAVLARRVGGGGARLPGTAVVLALTAVSAALALAR